MSTCEDEIETHCRVGAPRVNQFRSIITIADEMQRQKKADDSLGRLWHTYIHTYIRIYVRICVCAYVCVCTYIYIYIHIYIYTYTRTCAFLRAREEKVRRESSRRCNDHCLQSLLLHYSSPKWMMQIMFRANSRIYTHAQENLYAFTLTHMGFSFFLALVAGQRFPFQFNS